MEESLPVIQFTHRTTGEVRVGHFHPPSTKLPSEWTDGYGNRVAAPADVTEWIAGGGGGGGGGGEGAPVGAKYIVQQPSDGLTAEQALSELATGILKNTTTTGVLSIATGSDLPSHSHVLADVTDAGTIASQDADSVAITGGSLENVTVTTGTYSSKVNETLMHAVRKASAGTITKGQVIRITGSSGVHLLCELADATDEATSSKTIAVAATEITTTSGYMMVQGELTGLSNVPTASFTNGDALWLSETAGEFTTTKPTQPAHGVFLGWVVNANNGSAGRIFVKIINYQELDELHDVLISGIADKQILVWDDVAKLWKNQNQATAGSKTIARFTAKDNQPPATNFATLDTRNSLAVLDFDDGATNESAVFVGVIPEAAVLTSGLKVRIEWMATSATSGAVKWGAQLERGNTDIDSDSFDTAVTAITATSGTSGISVWTEITLTTIDSVAAGERFRLKVYRDSADTTNDTMAGDAELVAVEVRTAN